MASMRVPVLITGAGPTGLALAIELGTRGVGCLVVERNDRVGYAPRAKTTHTRTREHLRRWGIAEKLAAASPFGVDYPSDIRFVTRLGGRELHVISNAFNCAPGRDDAYAEHAQWIPQYKLEEVLRAHAETLPCVEIRFGCEFQDARQDPSSVRSTLKDLGSGVLSEVESAFLVGADGARSAVRSVVGAKLEGAHGLSHNYNIIFRAPGLAEAHHLGPAIMYWQLNGDVPSVIGPMDSDGRWFFTPPKTPEIETLDDAQTADLIRRATGIDLPYEILSRDEWVASQLIADKYREGRMFLAGDACHLHPPFGGYGMNMGIADGVDLGWKIAAVLQGWGGEALLDSYEVERRQVHQQVVDEAVANHRFRTGQLYRPGLEGDGPEGDAIRAEVAAEIERTKLREFRSLGVVLGSCYAASPVIAYGEEIPQASPAWPYEPSAAPGRRAPHLWLEDGRSLFDLFGAGFTLLVLPGAEPADCEAIERDFHDAGAPLEVIHAHDPRLEPLYQATLVLIRPDQHVAWRGSQWPGPHIADLVLGRAASSTPMLPTPQSASPREDAASP